MKNLTKWLLTLLLSLALIAPANTGMIDDGMINGGMIAKNSSGGGMVGLEDVFYDLEWTGTGAHNQTFSDAQVLDTAAEGIPNFKGSLTVVDTSTGTVKVVSNRLELVGEGFFNKEGVYHTDGVNRSLGKAGLFTFNEGDASNQTFLGFNASAPLDDTPSFAIQLLNLVFLYTHGSTNITVGSTSVSTDYKALLLSGGYDSNGIPWKTGDTASSFLYGGRFFVKGGAFTSWTLLWADPNENDATLYLQFNRRHVAPGITIDNILIPTLPLNVDTMFNPAYLSTSPDESDHDTGVSDFVMEVVFTTPGAGTDPLDIRYRKAGTNDHWLVRVTPGTAGTDIEIIEDDGGETQRASADIDWAGTTEYRVTIIVDGDSYQRVYVDGVLKMTYTTTNTFNETETTIDLLKNSFTVSTVAVHRRTFSSWDAAISAATGGAY